MHNAVSEKVRTDAANSLLTHLKKPEVKEFQINMDVRDSSGMNELKDALRDMAASQMDAINRGVSTKEIASKPIVTIDAEVEDLPTLPAPSSLEPMKDFAHKVMTPPEPVVEPIKEESESKQEEKISWG